jgi:hypothetical protein
MVIVRKLMGIGQGRSRLLALLWLAAAVVSVTAFAHHSTANFDTTKLEKVTGTVTYFAFTNPHSYFDMDVTDAKGKVHSYKIFTLARVVMARNGWGVNDLKAGDKVTITGNPDRKTPNFMYLQSITFASGREWTRDSAY